MIIYLLEKETQKVLKEFLNRQFRMTFSLSFALTAVVWEDIMLEVENMSGVVIASLYDGP